LDHFIHFFIYEINIIIKKKPIMSIQPLFKVPVEKLSMHFTTEAENSFKWSGIAQNSKKVFRLGKPDSLPSFFRYMGKKGNTFSALYFTKFLSWLRLITRKRLLIDIHGLLLHFLNRFELHILKIYFLLRPSVSVIALTVILLLFDNYTVS